MKIRTIAAVAALGVVSAGALAPATAAPKKKKAPISKSYDLQLLPVWTDPFAACADENLERISVHTEVIKPTGPGILTVKTTGYQGDWDISIKNSDNEEIVKGSGNDTPNAGPGEETALAKFKKGQEIRIAICNFAGTPASKASFTYTYTG